MPELSADTVIDGRYRVLSRIGSGGMADVYCAEDSQLGRRVAVKVLHRRFAEDQEFVERFRREASSAAGLQHPNVVGVYDRGEWDGTYYIAMEFLDGRSLKQIVTEDAPLDPPRAIDFAIQILKASRFAHKRGIIHRDLKPHNAIVDAEGRLKVTDFGIARAGASDMTQTGSIMGTAQYLSPEQAQGHAVSAQSDLYSVGIVLYEMLTGKVPFEGDTAVAIAVKQVNEVPVAPSLVNPEIPPDLDAVVMRALQKLPEHRFADAEEFISALEAVRERIARNDPAEQDTASWAAVGALAPTNVAGPAVPPPLPLSPAERGEPFPLAPPAPPPARDRAAGPRRWPWLILALLVIGGIVLAFLLLQPRQVEVPNVTGLQLDAASTVLRNEGFRVDAERVRNDAPRDRVLNQDPSPGDEADDGSTVTLTVSDGPGEETVPDVRGITERSAVNRLRRAGFRVDRERATDDEIPEGRAIRTSPAEGEQVERGETVTLYISSGRDRVEVPSVVGQSREEAESTLEDLELRVRVRGQESDDEDPGTVLQQNPAPGTEVEEGETVEIVVAEEPENAEVPDVLGETQADAIAALQDRGFQVGLDEREVPTPDGDGVVLEQRPSAGRQLRRGRTVTIVVGSFDPTQPPTPQPTPPAPPPPG